MIWGQRCIMAAVAGDVGTVRSGLWLSSTLVVDVAAHAARVHTWSEVTRQHTCDECTLHFTFSVAKPTLLLTDMSVNVATNRHCY